VATEDFLLKVSTPRSQSGISANLFTYKQEVAASNLDWIKDHPDKGLLSFSSVSPCEFRDITLKEMMACFQIRANLSFI
jgi:hypothetical protein